MIIVVSKNKKINTKVNQEKLELIYNILITNPEIWFTGKQLETLSSYTNIRRVICTLRNEGIPIISDIKKGYKFTTNKDEILNCYKKLKERALKQLTAAQQMKKLL